jgi:hypothetical protein
MTVADATDRVSAEPTGVNELAFSAPGTTQRNVDSAALATENTGLRARAGLRSVTSVSAGHAPACLKLAVGRPLVPVDSALHRRDASPGWDREPFEFSSVGPSDDRGCAGSRARR